MPRDTHINGVLAPTPMAAANFAALPHSLKASLRASMDAAYHDRDNGINTYVMTIGEKITFVSTLGERLMNAREAKGLTQQQLADAACVSQGTIGNIESGARKRPRDLLKIARALDVDPD